MKKLRSFFNMKKLRSFFKKLKEKSGFRWMTEEEYQEYLKKKGHSGVSDSCTPFNPGTRLPSAGDIDYRGNPYGSGRD